VPGWKSPRRTGYASPALRSGKIKGARRLLRGIRELWLSAVIWRLARKFLAENPCDLVIFFSPPVFFGPLVRKLKAMWRCPSYLVLRDIWPQFLLDTGVLRKGPIYQLMRRAERQQYAVADVIGVQTPGDLVYFAQHLPAGGPPVEVLLNWMSLEQQEVPANDYRRRLGLDRKVVFFYGGNFGIAQDLENILRLAANMAAEPRAFFLLVGAGTEAKRLYTLARNMQLKNLLILPAVEQKEYQAMLSEFDVGLISLNHNFCIQNIPGKLMSYFYWRKPVLASVNPGNDLKPMLAEAQAGLCCWNGEDEVLREYASVLVEDPELRARCGKNGRRLLEETFSVEGATRQLLAHFLPVETIGEPRLASSRTISAAAQKAGAGALGGFSQFARDD
jgi:glycosyltransferase involved in cell wall biosynthesis